VSEEEKKYDQIEAFLRKEMTEEQQQDFLARVEADPNLKEELKLHAEIEGVLTDYEKFKAKERWSKLTPDRYELSEPAGSAEPAELSAETGLSTDSSELGESAKDTQVKVEESKASSPGILRRLMPVAMAIAAIALMFFAWSLVNTGVEKSAPQLAEVYYEKPQQLINLTRSNNFSQALEKVNADFVYGEYGKAISALIANKDLSPRDRDLYMGICVFADGKAKEASTILDPLANDARYEKREQAIWYLALAQLRLDRKAPAVKWLTLMRDQKLGNQKQVQALLADLAD